MEVAVPVDRTAPKIIKPNEISIRTASQNNCEPELLRPFASKVHIGTDGNLVISKPNFIDMNKLFIKDNPNIELQNIVDPLELNQKYQPSTSLLTAKVNGSNTMLLIMSNSVVKHEVPDQSDVIVKKKEAAADGDTHQPVITMKQEETIADEHNVPIRSQQQTSHSIQGNSRVHPRRRNLRHSRKSSKPTHTLHNSIDIIKCETAENGKAMLSVNGILNSSMLSRRRRSRKHDLRNATLTRYKVFQCKLCSSKYLTLKNLNIHNRQHNCENLVVCDKCGIIFLGSDSFQMHKCKYTSKAILTCKLCDSRFETPLKYSKHDCQTRTTTRVFSCEICRIGFTSLLKYKRHRRTHTDRSLFCCKICNSIFKTSRQFLDHSRIHTGEKPYTCDTCLDTFKSQYCLNRHRVVHKGVKLHYCSICRAAFRNVLGLARHNRTHIDQQSNVCVKCNARFSTTDELVQHSVVHDGEKPYMCYMCNGTFYFAHNLDQHLRLSDCASKIKNE